jgi:hypothetical protein
MRIDVREFHSYTVEQLEKLPTRQLMAVRDAAYHIQKCSCGAMPGSCDGGLSDYEKECNHQQYLLQDRVKDVLSKREHVPSKPEAKALRRAAAKRKT